jgi:hypothetical protein
MSVLVGTSTGRVYLYSLEKKKVLARRGECSLANAVTGLNWLGASRNIVYANRKGELVVSNIDDELQTVGDKVIDDCVSMTSAHTSVVVGDKSGNLKLISLDYTQEDDSYALGEPTALLDKPRQKLVKVAFDQHTNTRVGVLCKEQPPAVS